MDFESAQKLVSQHGTPTLFLSKNRIQEGYRALRYALPGVEHFYAVKSNADPQIIKWLAAEGCSFDVCTNGEIDILKECGIGPGICLHTHPIKRENDIRYALNFGINLFVADNEFELEKLVPFKDRAQAPYQNEHSEPRMPGQPVAEIRGNADPHVCAYRQGP